jgi:hypothetical protein
MLLIVKFLANLPLSLLLIHRVTQVQIQMKTSLGYWQNQNLRSCLRPLRFQNQTKNEKMLILFQRCPLCRLLNQKSEMFRQFRQFRQQQSPLLQARWPAQ